jgi:hypothetical protein
MFAMVPPHWNIQGGVLPIKEGGTGAKDVAGARRNLGIDTVPSGSPDAPAAGTTQSAADAPDAPGESLLDQAGTGPVVTIEK